MTIKYLFGTAGWSYEDWRGRVYPPGAGSRFDALAFLAAHFDLVEVNATFYRLPRPEIAESWLRRCETWPDFVFLLKAPRDWTHGGADPRDTGLDTFRDLAGILAGAGRLGAILLQFPWSFRNTAENRERVSRLREALNGLPVAVEVRHGAFSDPAWAEYLRRLDCLPVNVDQPAVGDALSLGALAGRQAAYVRLHGRRRESWFDPEAGRDVRYDYLYGPSELDALAASIRETAGALPRVLAGANAATGEARVYVVTNNHYLGQAVVNGLQLRHALLGGLQAVPPHLLALHPELASIALPPRAYRERLVENAPPGEDAGQGRLF